MKCIATLLLSTILFAQEEGNIPQELDRLLLLPVDEQLPNAIERDMIEESNIGFQGESLEGAGLERSEIENPSISVYEAIEQAIPLPQIEQSEREDSEKAKPEFVDLTPLTGSSKEAASSNETSLYQKLLITEEAELKIRDILGTMAKHNVFKLLFERKRLEKLGDEIRFVHPIRFIGTVFSDPYLVHCMREIAKTSFKWNGFIDGFGNRFREEIKAGNVVAYLPELAELLNVSLSDLKSYVHYKDFEGMVLYLMKKSHFG